MRSSNPLAPIVVSFVLAACGGSQPAAPETPAAPSAAPAAASAPSASAAEPAPSASAAEAPAPSAGAAAAAPAEPAKPKWDDMTVDQKKNVMRSDVLPTMKAAFQEFDAKRFADMSCKTCHGPSAKEGKFTMPNPALPKLDPTGMFEKHKKKDPKILAFMMEHVVPTMAKIIGEAPYDPATKQGFGCFECHTMAGK